MAPNDEPAQQPPPTRPDEVRPIPAPDVSADDAASVRGGQATEGVKKTMQTQV